MTYASANATEASASTADATSTPELSTFGRAFAIYLALVNAGAVGLFGWDKLQAILGGWRISELQLCLNAAAGGWGGGLLAMQVFRHKIRSTVSCVLELAKRFRSV